MLKNPPALTWFQAATALPLASNATCGFKAPPTSSVSSKPAPCHALAGAPLTQVTATLLTAALARPLPFCTEQVWPAGWVSTVTAYGAPAATGAAKLKTPLAGTARLFAPLFCSTRPAPVRPLTMPPMAKVEKPPGVVTVNTAPPLVTRPAPL